MCCLCETAGMDRHQTCLHRMCWKKIIQLLSLWPEFFDTKYASVYFKDRMTLDDLLHISLQIFATKTLNHVCAHVIGYHFILFNLSWNRKKKTIVWKENNAHQQRSITGIYFCIQTIHLHSNRKIENATTTAMDGWRFIFHT